MEEILKDLKAKIYSPVYFLYGEEPYFIDVLSDYIESHVLDEAEKEFNQTILYGKEVELATVLSHAKRFPMMSNYQVIVVREAQEIKNLLPKKGSDEDKDNSVQEALMAYLDRPQPTTILVFCCKYRKLNKGSRLYKNLLKNKFTAFASEKMYDSKIPSWIQSFVPSKGYKINPKASELLAQHLGNDLGKIVNELGKIFINLKPGEEITPEHIERYIGISKEYNVFELQAALGKKDAQKSFAIVKYFGANKKENPMVMTLATLYGYFSKIISYHSLADKSRGNVASALGVNPFFVSDYETAAKNYSLPKLTQVIAILHEFDLKSKGILSTSADEGELLREMVARII